MARKLLFLAAALLMLIALAGGAYLSDYYPADPDALRALSSTDQITVTIRDDMVIFSPSLPEAGLLFYPGGKVEHTAYSPLMQALAEQNILCVLLKMPGNLALLDIDAAQKVPPCFPQIQRWYLGGHSLGGSMAALWAADNPDAIQGLVLLASYSTADLTRAGFPVLSIYGSEDSVLNLEKEQQFRCHLPESTTEILIPGGNHAQFGSYGPQDGDGTASISPQDQISLTAEALVQFILP